LRDRSAHTFSEALIRAPKLIDVTKRRNAIASQMLSMLEASTFNGKEFDEGSETADRGR
jgi:hypothetical protein